MCRPGIYTRASSLNCSKALWPMDIDDYRANLWEQLIWGKISRGEGDSEEMSVKNGMNMG